MAFRGYDDQRPADSDREIVRCWQAEWNIARSLDKHANDPKQKIPPVRAESWKLFVHEIYDGGLGGFFGQLCPTVCADDFLKSLSTLRVSYGKRKRPGLDQGTLLRCLFAQGSRKNSLVGCVCAFRPPGSHKVRAVVLVPVKVYFYRRAVLVLWAAVTPTQRNRTSNYVYI